MDKINFANAHTPSQELQLARWYTVSCMAIILMFIGMCSTYVMQWRTLQQITHKQQSHAAHQSLMQEHAQLESQQNERSQRRSNQTITQQKLKALVENLGADIYLDECVIIRDGSHNLTLSAPSGQRAQECIAALNKKQLFGALTITSLKMVKSGAKNRLLVTIKGTPAL